MHAAGGGHLQVVQWLIEHNADLIIVSKSGSNAFHRATTTGHIEVAKYLTTKPELKDVNLTTSRGCTALHYAARNKHVEMVRWLVEEQGASCQAKDNRGEDLEAIVKKMKEEQLTLWFENWRLNNETK